MSGNDFGAIGERLTRLEREVRLWKRGATATMVLLVALFAFGPTTRMREARAADSGAQDLVVRSLKIVDEKGKQRAGLTVLEDGPNLRLTDEKGKGRASLAVNEVGSALVLNDDKGKLRAGLAVFKDGPALGLNDEKGKERAGIAVDEDGPKLRLTDEKRKQIWRAP
jgi:hypothetical protein